MRRGRALAGWLSPAMLCNMVVTLLSAAKAPVTLSRNACRADDRPEALIDGPPGRVLCNREAMADPGRAFLNRGLMECFYGPHWTPAARAAAVQAIAESGGDLYVYGPAADSRTGEDWRSPYDGPAAEQQNQLIAAADAHGVRAAWRVSPSAPLNRARAMRLGDPDEQTILVDRCLEQVARGYRLIVIAFDDVDTEIDPATRARFGRHRHPLAAAQAAVVDRVVEAVAERGAEVVVCPTHYWGVEPSAYRSWFGAEVRSPVPFWWTGPQVCSESITAEQARRVAEQFQHPLWIWDNYPVNDWTTSELHRQLRPAGSGGLSNDHPTSRLLAGPLDRRDPALAEVVTGYASNGGAHAGVSRLVGRTALAFARDPDGYRPADAFRQAAEAERLPVRALEAVVAELGSTPVSATPGALARIAGRLLAAPAGEADLTDAETEELDGLASGIGDLGDSDSDVVADLQPWLTELGWATAAVRTAVAVFRSWVRADAAALHTDASTMREIARAGVLERPQVADGAVDALIARVHGLVGPQVPPWPDDEPAENDNEPVAALQAPISPQDAIERT